MAHCLSRILSPVLEALSRLVHFLFASKRVVDAEGGTLAPVVLGKSLAMVSLLPSSNTAPFLAKDEVAAKGMYFPLSTATLV